MPDEKSPQFGGLLSAFLMHFCSGKPMHFCSGVDMPPSMSKHRGSYTLAEYPGDMVRLACNRCGRRGQYRKATLIARYGADVPLPDIRLLIAECERYDRVTGGCRVHFPDLAPNPPSSPGSPPGSRDSWT
jgi:hypothetical protein